MSLAELQPHGYIPVSLHTHLVRLTVALLGVIRFLHSVI